MHSKFTKTPRKTKRKTEIFTQKGVSTKLSLVLNVDTVKYKIKKIFDIQIYLILILTLKFKLLIDKSLIHYCTAFHGSERNRVIQQSANVFYISI